jgi:glycosyltransferase involved in cell wall biosynthesis
MTAQRRVLVIAYYFPPLGLSGVQRTLKFVKYLPNFGWQPTVLTVTPTGYYAQDYSLLDELHPLHIDIVRAGSLDPNRVFRKKGVIKMPSERWRKVLTFLSDTFFIPDNKIGWKRKALQAAENIFKQQPFDVIFATAPPFTDFLIGLELHKKLKKPLVVDYRDPWLEYPFKYYPTPLHKLFNYKLEKQVLRASAKIICTNRRVKELILKRYKFLSYDDVLIVPQGYDPADFRDGAAPRPVKKETMVIAHAGVFYGDRTPKYFFRAMKKIFSERPELKGKIETWFIGNFHDEHRALAKELEIESDIVLTGYLDHRHCVQHLMAADVLWLMVGNDRQSPGKLYEYLGARKPILACVPEGFLKQTIEEAEAGVIVAPNDVDGIASNILRYYELYRSGQLPKPKEDVVQKYNREKLTHELAKIFGFLAE